MGARDCPARTVAHHAARDRGNMPGGTKTPKGPWVGGRVGVTTWLVAAQHRSHYEWPNTPRVPRTSLSQRLAMQHHQQPAQA